MKKLPVIIDTDPGIDDAVAILLALASPEFDVLGITAVAGNVPLERTVTNALTVRRYAKAEQVPVYAGATRPLLRQPAYAVCHGHDGLGGYGESTAMAGIECEDAVSFLIRIFREAAQGKREKITLCPLAPLTNIALALSQAPDIISGIERIVLMGGAFCEPGNVTPAAEFNIYTDPHAARIVFSCGVPLVFLPLDVTHKTLVTAARLDALQKVGNKAADFAAKLLANCKENPVRFAGKGIPLHDPTVFGWLLHPEYFTARPAYVEVECESELCMGYTLADFYGKKGKPFNAQVVTDLNADAFFADLTARLHVYDD